MSVTITTDVFCDQCGNWAHYGTHPTKAVIAEALRGARRAGWTVKRDGSCTCPQCNGIDKDYFWLGIDPGPKQLPSGKVTDGVTGGSDAAD